MTARRPDPRRSCAARGRRSAGLWLGALGALAAVLACAGPSPAVAQTLDGGRFFPAFGPRLAGDELVWVPLYRPTRGYRVEAQSLSGGPARTIFETATDAERYGLLVNGLAASPEQVLVAQRGPRGPTAVQDSEVFRIGRDGAAEALGRGTQRLERQIELSGNVGIYNGSEPGATIRDFARPPSERVLVGPVSGQMRVAGRYAAWEDAGDIVVYDRAARSELYRVPGVWPGFYDRRDLDLQADGKVAFYFEESGGRQSLARVAWASPQEPFPHRVSVRDDASYKLTMNDDRIVFVRHEGLRLSRRLDITTSFGELGVVGLDGGDEQVLVRPVESATFEDYFDFDGERVAWQARGCRGVLLRSKPLRELMADPRLRSVRRPRGCRLRLRAPARPRGRRGRLLGLPVDCAGFARDCFVERTVLRTLRAHRLGDRRVPRGTRVSARNLGPLPARNRRVTLTATGRRLVGRRGRIRLGVRTIIGDNGFVERRRGRITVR